jgi:hypothetical protein
MIAALLFNPYLLMLFTHTLFPVILLIWQYLTLIDVHDNLICLFAEGLLVFGDFNLKVHIPPLSIMNLRLS